MRITYSWIKEFLEITMSPDKLAASLTMAGLSVASLERVGDEWVYDIEVTSNRPDWLSVRGIVHEVAAVTGARFKKTVPRPTSHVRTGKSRSADGFSLRIDDTKGCGLYWGGLLRNVKVGPSPAWLKNRLEALGVRSVNNVVDITNHEMLEFGQPLHAFDFDKLDGGAIVVRRARANEPIVLIDGTEKKLTGDILVIADQKKPVAAAGIMGGRDTEVSDKTANILLESAYFDPVTVRRGARCLGLGSEASYRFERGVDVATVRTAFEKAITRIVEVTGASFVGARAVGSAKPPAPRRIIFDLAQASDVLGMEMKAVEATNCLKRLGFSVKKKGKLFEAIAPAFRRDIRAKEDIFEELARIKGYEEIPLTSPSIKPFVYHAPVVLSLEASARRAMTGMGFKESLTYSLTNEAEYKKLGLSVPDDALLLENPLSQEYHILRTTLAPGLLGCVALNISRGNRDLEIFEVARTYRLGKETVTLGAALAGRRRNSWEMASSCYTFFDAKGMIEALLASLGIVDFSFVASQRPFADKIACVDIFIGSATAGYIALLSQAAKREEGIKTKDDIFLAELDLEEAAAARIPRRAYKPLASVPSIHRDISLIAGPGSPFARLEALVKKVAGDVVRSVALAGLYEGKEIPQGHVGLTMGVDYGVANKTLTDAEVNSLHQRVLEALVQECGVVLR